MTCSLVRQSRSHICILDTIHITNIFWQGLYLDEIYATNVIRHSVIHLMICSCQQYIVAEKTDGCKFNNMSHIVQILNILYMCNLNKLSHIPSEFLCDFVPVFMVYQQCSCCHSCLYETNYPTGCPAQNSNFTKYLSVNTG